MSKVPSTCTSTSPGKPQLSPQQLPAHTSKQSSPSSTGFGQPLTTLANGFNTSVPPTSATHSISTPLISSPISHPSAITNGTSSNSLGSLAQPPASLSVGVPQPPAATAPTVATPTLHPSLDSSSAGGRTNSPAVATSAVLSAAAPAANGNSNATTVSTNGGIPAYRSGYPGYPLYAPYSNLHHPYLPPAVSSPSASPRTVDSRGNRESPLINSKGMRPLTPNSANNGMSSQMPPSSGIPSGLASQPPSNLRDQQHPHQQHQSQHLTTPTSIQKAHSPRGHSPTRERDSYR